MAKRRGETSKPGQDPDAPQVVVGAAPAQCAGTTIDYSDDSGGTEVVRVSLPSGEVCIENPRRPAWEAQAQRIQIASYYAMDGELPPARECCLEMERFWQDPDILPRTAMEVAAFNSSLTADVADEEWPTLFFGPVSIGQVAEFPALRPAEPGRRESCPRCWAIRGLIHGLAGATLAAGSRYKVDDIAESWVQSDRARRSRTSKARRIRDALCKAADTSDVKLALEKLVDGLVTLALVEDLMVVEDLQAEAVEYVAATGKWHGEFRWFEDGKLQKISARSVAEGK